VAISRGVGIQAHWTGSRRQESVSIRPPSRLTPSLFKKFQKIFSIS
jgi:hypothetical protein